MIHAAYAHPDSAEPADGDELASTLAWALWCDFVAARHAQYPAAAQLALWGWSDKPDDLAHELEQLIHDGSDEDMTAVTAQVLSAVRATPEGATFYTTDGEPADSDETAESVVREEHGAPPFPGAVFDTNSHRWKLPPHDATDEHGQHPAETKAKSLAARIAEVPAAVASRVSGWVANKYKSLSDRYGPTGAKAVLGAMVLLSPVPVPGTSLLPIALAEAVLRIRKAVAGESVQPELSADEVEAISRQLLAELEEEMKT